MKDDNGDEIQIEIKIVERFAPIQLNMENHSFAFAKFGKAQALSVVASL